MTALPRIGNVAIEEVLDCLNHYRLRATYEAVGKAIGCFAVQVGPQYLVSARPATSWVVLKDTHLPSPHEYTDNPLLAHPDLACNDHVIEDPDELLTVIAAYRVRHLTGS